ncbi:MAG: tRNA lysidine(34) synthetase TilS [Candidatus Saccharimonadales bacterium]
MELELKSGKYVLAVSGGVDSVVLLDILCHNFAVSKTRSWKDVVAHFDHGIRADSGDDRKFVQKLAAKYGLDFFYDEGKLGAKASEALAREKRYEFLEKVRAQTKSQAIITAHHQDDLLETAIINIMRGTGRKGLSSLASTDLIRRPMLGFSKAEIKNYALKNKLEWREDPSNKQEKYLRNYVRRQIVAKFSLVQRQTWLDKISSASNINQAADQIISNLLAEHSQNNKLDRLWFCALPHDVSKEVLAAWLRSKNASFDRRQLERLTILTKTRAPGKRLDVDKYVKIGIEPKFLNIIGTRLH